MPSPGTAQPFVNIKTVIMADNELQEAVTRYARASLVKSVGLMIVNGQLAVHPTNADALALIKAFDFATKHVLARSGLKTDVFEVTPAVHQAMQQSAHGPTVRARDAMRSDWGRWVRLGSRIEVHAAKHKIHVVPSASGGVRVIVPVGGSALVSIDGAAAELVLHCGAIVAESNAHVEACWTSSGPNERRILVTRLDKDVKDLLQNAMIDKMIQAHVVEEKGLSAGEEGGKNHGEEEATNNAAGIEDDDEIENNEIEIEQNDDEIEDDDDDEPEQTDKDKTTRPRKQVRISAPGDVHSQFRAPRAAQRRAKYTR